MVSTLIVVGGVVCIVATAGIATPVVAPAVATGIGIAGGIVGGTTIVYGESNFIEGTQDIYYGSVGDYSTAAWNPVRDTVFMGNQQAYDIFGTVCVISSSVLSLGAGAIGAAGAATQATTSVARAVGVYGAKVAFTAGAGAAGGYVSKEAALALGASETMAQVWGIAGGVVAGAAAGFGAQAVDKRFNLSGFYRPQVPTVDLDSVSVDDTGYTEGANSGIPNAVDLKNSDTVQNHMDDIIKKGVNKGQLSRPYVDSDGTTLLLDEIMNAAPPVQDSVLPNGLRWDVQGTFRGATGTWELVVDTATNTIVHFNFVR